jgi:hypothetical protein
MAQTSSATTVMMPPERNARNVGKEVNLTTGFIDQLRKSNCWKCILRFTHGCDLILDDTRWNPGSNPVFSAGGEL